HKKTKKKIPYYFPVGMSGQKNLDFVPNLLWGKRPNENGKKEPTEKQSSRILKRYYNTNRTGNNCK
ncbi:MAG: hypothetical protein Q8Q13_01455, partial [bacterium]|nr:hypothetical protein [bacterium]